MKTANRMQLEADVAEAEDIAAELSRRAARRYTPHTKQELFHRAVARVRGLFTGNRFGKTDATVREALFWASGRHPFRPIPNPPNFIRYYVDGRKGEHFSDVVFPKFRAYTDPRDIGGEFDDVYVKGEYLIPFLNGSRIKFVSYNLVDSERSTTAYGGAEVDLHIFDEHGALEIYREAGIRFGMESGGQPEIVVAYTPLIGKAAWEYREIYQRWERGEPGYEVVTGSIWDNTPLIERIGREGVEQVLRDMPENERLIRESGIFVQSGGAVYPMFERARHFVPYDPIRIAVSTKTVLIDPHPSFAKGHKVIWCGVDPDGRGFCYRARSYHGLPVNEIADKIRAESKAERHLNEDIRRWYLDGAPQWWTDTDELNYAKQYRDAGIPVERASRDKMGGIQLMQSWLTVSPTTRHGNFEVMDTCPDVADEFEWYSWMPQTDAMKASDRWKTYDENDDYVTLCRYFVQTDPRYQGRPKQAARQSESPTMRALRQRREMV